MDLPSVVTAALNAQEDILGVEDGPPGNGDASVEQLDVAVKSEQDTSSSTALCSKCSQAFVPLDSSRTFCSFCESSSTVELAVKPCAACSNPFAASDGTRIYCDNCKVQFLANCVVCQTQFLPSVESIDNVCDTCREKRPKMCTKCNNVAVERSSLCARCSAAEASKREASAPRKCAGCSTVIGNTPRKFCDTCREENEKPQVSEALKSVLVHV